MNILNWFNSKKTETVTTPVPKKVSIVDQIHADFDTAIDSFMKDVNGLINQHLIDQGDRLRRLGFAGSQQAEQSRSMKNMAEVSIAAKDYSVRYPHHKFITPQLVEQICKKWGLIIGPVGSFIGRVPEKNIQDMENFVLQKRDMYSGWSLPHVFNQLRFFYNDDTPMFICAPAKDFNQKGMKVSGVKLEIEDPIVLQPVKHGYLIVTKWGPEASDPALINEQSN